MSGLGILLLAPWLLSGCLAASFPRHSAPAALNWGPPLGTVRLPAGGSVVVPLGERHPAKLAVMRPDGSWVYLVDDAWVPEPLMSEALFAQVRLLRIDATAWRGTPGIGGKAKPERVFSAPGHYRLYLADNLDTEPENTVALWIEVDYRAR